MEKFDIRVKNFELLKNQKENIERASYLIIEALKNSNKILLCGNGGSASDCNHISAEFIGRFQKERKPLNAISLCSNNSIITAISNDYGFENVFKRQIEAQGNFGDILIAISTSAKSKNIINAINQAKSQGLKVILLTGENKSNLDIDVEINAPSSVTCQIQEMHIATGHIICEIAEDYFFTTTV